MKRIIKQIILVSICSTLLLTGCGASAAETTDRIMNDVEKKVENGISEIQKKWDKFTETHKNRDELDNDDVDKLCEEIIGIERNLCTVIYESTLECVKKTLDSGEEVEKKSNTLDYLSRRVENIDRIVFGYTNDEFKLSIDHYLKLDIADGLLYNSDSAEGKEYRAWWDSLYRQLSGMFNDIEMEFNDTLSNTRSLSMEIAAGVASESKSGSSSYLKEKVNELKRLCEESK